jgi:CRP-like cAMP-binding protein
MFRLLADVPPEDQKDLLELARERQFQAYEEVVREGEPHEGLFIIQEGSVEVFRMGEEPGGSEGLGVEESLTRFNAGNFFGDLVVFDPGPASASVRTTRPSKILLLPREKFLDFLDSRPKAAIRIYRNILSEMAMRLRRIDAKLVERIVWVQEGSESAEGGGE